MPWRKAWQSTLVFLPGESHGQRGQEGCSAWGHRVGHDWVTLFSLFCPLLPFHVEKVSIPLVAQMVKRLPTMQTLVQSLGREDPLEKEMATHSSTLAWEIPRMEEPGRRLPTMRPTFNPWVGKIPWRRKWQPTPVLLPGKSHRWRSLVGYSPWGRKESDTTEWPHFFKFLLITSLSLLSKLLVAF